MNTYSIELIKSIEENATKLIAIEKALQATEKEEEAVQNKIEVFEDHLEKRCL